MRTFFDRYPQILHRAAVLLAALALCGLTSCGKSDPANAGFNAQPNGKIEDAAMAGDVETVKAMLKAEPKLKFDRTTGGGTLLHQAADGGHKEMVEFLLAEGADLTAQNNGGGTPLHRAAAISGSKEIAELLLAKGAEVNARNHGGETPLRQAINKGHTEVADVLRQHGGTE